MNQSANCGMQLPHTTSQDYSQSMSACRGGLDMPLPGTSSSDVLLPGNSHANHSMTSGSDGLHPGNSHSNRPMHLMDMNVSMRKQEDDDHYSHQSSPGLASTSMNSSSSPIDDHNTSNSPGKDIDPDGSFKMPPKKRPVNVDEEQKDEGYWEKRKKNNESAKRSREARRMKEEQIALRVVFLEQENLQLKTEVSLLKSEIEKLRCMLYNS